MEVAGIEGDINGLGCGGRTTVKGEGAVKDGKLLVVVIDVEGKIEISAVVAVVVGLISDKGDDTIIGEFIRIQMNKIEQC